MEVAVAGVAEGADGQIVGPADLLDGPDHVGDLAPGHGGVLQHQGRLGLGQGRQGPAPGLPDIVPFGGVFGHADAQGAPLLADGRHLVSVFFHLGRVAVHFHEQQRRGVGGQAHLAVRLHGPDGEIVHELQGGRHDPGRDDGRHRLGGRLDFIEDGDHRFPVGRQGDQFEDDLLEHPQGPLGADHEGRQVVPGGAFDGPRAGLDDIAVHVEKLQAHDIVPGHAVFESPEPAGVLRHVAPQGGNRLAARIRRIEEPFGLHRRRQFGRHHAGLHPRVHVGLVDLQDPVEAVGDDDHAARVGDGSAGKIGAGAAHRQGQPVLVAEPDGRAQGLGGGGTEGRTGHGGLQHRRVIGISNEIGLVGEDVFGTDDLLEGF